MANINGRETVVDPAARLPAQLRRIFAEAHRRRHLKPGDINNTRPLTQAWLGLGLPSEYRPAVEAGLMVAHGGETRGVLNWYLLTEAGAALYRVLYGKD